MEKEVRGKRTEEEDKEDDVEKEVRGRTEEEEDKEDSEEEVEKIKKKTKRKWRRK